LNQAQKVAAARVSGIAHSAGRLAARPPAKNPKASSRPAETAGVGRPERAIGQQVRKRRRHDLDAAQIDPVAAREDGIEAIGLVGLVEVGIADEHHPALQIGRGGGPGAQRDRDEAVLHALLHELAVGHGPDRAGRPVEVEVAVARAGIERGERTQQGRGRIGGRRYRGEPRLHALGELRIGEEHLPQAPHHQSHVGGGLDRPGARRQAVQAVRAGRREELPPLPVDRKGVELEGHRRSRRQVAHARLEGPELDRRLAELGQRERRERGCRVGEQRRRRELLLDPGPAAHLAVRALDRLAPANQALEEHDPIGRRDRQREHRVLVARLDPAEVNVDYADRDLPLGQALDQRRVNGARPVARQLGEAEVAPGGAVDRDHRDLLRRWQRAAQLEQPGEPDLLLERRAQGRKDQRGAA
jgi:hypothetical protein